VNRSGGASKEGQSSADEAAGSSPAAGVNTVYEGQALPDGSLLPGGAVGRPGSSRKPRRPWRVAFVALALASPVAIVAWALLGSWLLVVRSVVVTGTHLVPTSEVLAVAGVERGTPLIRVNVGQVAARIETIRQVQSAQVTRDWPDRVVIVVSERTSALAVTAPGGGFDLVDEGGVIVRWAARRPADLPLYPAPAPGTAMISLRGDPDLAAAAAVLGGLPAPLRHAVESVSAPSPDQVTLQLSGGITVVWGDASDARRKARELVVLMQAHTHYYDVSAPGTATTN
jgi:cell division protein FtsQ